MDSRRRPGGGKRGVGPLIAGVFGIVAVACMLSVFYVHELKATMQGETDRYLAEIAQHVATLVNDRVETSFRTLETVAEEWNTVDWSETNVGRLQRIAERNGFDRIGIVDLAGHVRTSDGYERDISTSEAVRAALSGERGISDYFINEENEEEHMLYTVPLFKNGAVSGAISASVGKGQMRGLVSGESFGGEGFSHIIDSHGDVVVDSGHKNAVKGVENFFAMLETRGRLEQGCTLEMVEADMAAGRGGLLYATVDGMGRAMYYAKLNVEDWYVLSVVPTAVTTAKTARAVHLAVLINAVIMLLMLALTWVILIMARRSRQELEQLALTDPVTGGMNRTCFERTARRAIDSAPSGSWALVSMDIRHFKLINDAFTSGQGNRTLKYLHDVISRHLCGEEAVGRVSGDVFSVLLRRRSRGLTMAWLEEVAEDLNSFNEGQERQYYLSLAAGVYEVDEPELDMITIQDRANVARKKREAIKAGDLATCVFYTDVERLKLLREKEIDDRKENALVNHEFLVYLQPKMSLATGAVAGAEALVRWQDPERGLVGPDEFVPAFERNGFITRLDLYVFEEVCKILRQWTDRGWQPLPISVNLSRVHLQNPNFLREFQAVRNWYNVPSELIEFEFTETVATENLEGLICVIRDLHQMGFGCALDDFGSGYSSLNILKDVPVDVLKLDGAFFNGGGIEDTRGRFVVESVVELARRLDMQTVSEGVETEGQVEFLRKAGCDMVQGYIFSKPVPQEEFERLAFPGGEPDVEREEAKVR